MKKLLVILLCCHLHNVVSARYTNLMPSRLKRDTEDPNDDIQTENDDLSRLPADLGTPAKTSVNPPSPEENKHLPLLKPKDEDEIEETPPVTIPEENLPAASDVVSENKVPDIVVEDRLTGFVPPEEVPLGIVVKEPILVPLNPILPPPVSELKPVPVIPDVQGAEHIPPPPLVKIPLLKEIEVKEPLILPVQPLPPLVIPEVEPPPPVVPIEEPVPLPAPAIPEQVAPIPIPEVEPPPPPVVVVEEPVPPPLPVVPVEPVPPPPPPPPPPSVIEVVPPPPPPPKIPFLEEVVFKPPDLTSPFAKGTRWALYFSNMFLSAFSQVLASAQVTMAKFAQLAAP